MTDLRSTRDLADAKRLKAFVDREGEQRLFAALLRKNDLRILSFFGVGGIGKTTLLRKLLGNADRRGVVWALLDGTDKRLVAWHGRAATFFSALQILKTLAQQYTTASGGRAFFENFDARLRRLEELTAKLEKAYAANIKSVHPPLANELIGSTIGAAGSTVLGSTAVGSVLLGLPGAVVGAAVGTGMTAALNHLGRTREHLAQLKISDEEIDEYLNASSRLTESFVNSVNGLAQEVNTRKILLAIDNFQDLEPADEWFRSDLFGRLHPKVAVLLFGRDSLYLPRLGQMSGWHEIADTILEQEIRPLTTDASDKYLQKRKIDNERARQVFVEWSNGVPMALEAASRLWTSGRIRDEGLEGLTTSGMLNKPIVQRLLSQVADASDRELICACALCLNIEGDLLSAMLERDVGSALRELQDQYSIFDESEGRLVIKEPVQAFVLETEKRIKPKTMREWNQRAIEYYHDRLANEGAAADPTLIWICLHHVFCEDEEAKRLLVNDGVRRHGIRQAVAGDLAAILDVDWSAFGAAEDRFSLEQLQEIFAANNQGLWVVEDRESGEVLGFSLVIPLRREFAARFESGDLDIQDVVGPAVMSHDEQQRAPCIDYIIDSVVIRNPEHIYVGALLLRYIPGQLFKARKLYGIAASPYGSRLLGKLRFVRMNSKGAHSAPHSHEFYACCIFSPSNVSPVTKVLQKPVVDAGYTCQDCLLEWCPAWPGVAKGG